jgi:hypothetical protein
MKVREHPHDVTAREIGDRMAETGERLACVAADLTE